MVHPVSDIVIETILSVDSFLSRFRDVRMAKDHNLKPFQELLMGKGPKGGGGFRRSLLMVVPVTQLVQPLRNPPGESGTHSTKELFRHPVLEESPKSAILPLARVRQITVSDEGPFGAQPLFMSLGVNLHVHPEVSFKKGAQ